MSEAVRSLLNQELSDEGWASLLQEVRLKGLFLKERSAGVQLQPSETRTGLMTLPLKL